MSTNVRGMMIVSTDQYLDLKKTTFTTLEMTKKSTIDNHLFFDDAKPGNIIMDTTYDISHPSYLEEDMISEINVSSSWNRN